MPSVGGIERSWIPEKADGWYESRKHVGNSDVIALLGRFNEQHRPQNP